MADKAPRARGRESIGEAMRAVSASVEAPGRRAATRVETGAPEGQGPSWPRGTSRLRQVSGGRPAYEGAPASTLQLLEAAAYALAGFDRAVAQAVAQAARVWANDDHPHDERRPAMIALAVAIDGALERTKPDPFAA